MSSANFQAAQTTDALSAAIERAGWHLRSIQRPDGAVVGEVIWCPMLAAQWVLFHYAIGRSIAPEQARRLTRYFELQQQPDGAFGLHEESHGYLFTTVLCYTALRLLGHDLRHPVVSKAHDWLTGKNVTEIPTWGKMWLALVGLYDWRGVPPTPPELWLLPAESPVHPRRYYCHTRLIYLGFYQCLDYFLHIFDGLSPADVLRCLQVFLSTEGCHVCGFDLLHSFLCSFDHTSRILVHRLYLKRER